MGIIDNKRDTYLFYKYRVHEIYLLFSSGSYKLENERVNGLQITEDYVGNLYPIIKLTLALEPSIYYKLIQDKENVQVKLNLRKYYRENTEEKKSMFSNHINTTFKLILNDDDDFMGEKLHDLEYPEGDTEEMGSVTTEIDLYLFKADIIRANTENINFVIQNATVTTALTYMLTKIGAKNVLLSSIDNRTNYDTIAIPPMKLAKAIAYLDSFYGFHRTGSIVYFGFDRSYIIRYCAQSNAFSQGEEETITIIIPQTGSQLTDNICSLRRSGEENHIYLISDGDSFESSNEDVTQRILSPEEIDVLNNDTGAMESRASSDNKLLSLRKTENPFYAEIYNHQLRSNEVVISCSFRDCLAEEITPNKRYKFIFEDTKLTHKYSGLFCLTSKDSIYVKDGEDLTVGVTCEFRKIC